MLPTITVITLSMYITLIPTSASMLTRNEMTRLQLCNVIAGITGSDTTIITVPLSYPQAEYFVQLVPESFETLSFFGSFLPL